MVHSEDIFLAVICSTLLILLLIAVLVVVFFVAGKQRLKQEMLLAQTKLSFEQELRTVEHEVSEHVKGQFAQELHDNIGQLLTAIHIQVENQKLDYPQFEEGFKPMEIYLAEVSQQLRLLSRTMNNDYIGNSGLFTVLEIEVVRIRALKRFHIHWPEIKGDSNLDKNQELMVFRIFQEIMQNALRHSGAQNVFVEIINRGKQFELRVRDDGKGFMQEEILNSKNASGLRNIINRAKLAGLECEIKSSPGKGCVFQLKK